jgi:hypothetical protein
MTELDRKKEHLEALEVFLSGPAHTGYKAAVEFDIIQTKLEILNVEPISEVDRAEHFKLHGELRCLEEMLSVFEKARVELKARIDEIVETQLQNAENIKQ